MGGVYLSTYKKFQPVNSHFFRCGTGKCKMFRVIWILFSGARTFCVAFSSNLKFQLICVSITTCVNHIVKKAKNCPPADFKLNMTELALSLGI